MRSVPSAVRGDQRGHEVLVRRQLGRREDAEEHIVRRLDGDDRRLGDLPTLCGEAYLCRPSVGGGLGALHQPGLFETADGL